MRGGGERLTLPIDSNYYALNFLMKRVERGSRGRTACSCTDFTGHLSHSRFVRPIRFVASVTQGVRHYPTRRVKLHRGNQLRLYPRESHALPSRPDLERLLIVSSTRTRSIVKSYFLEKIFTKKDVHFCREKRRISSCRT